MKYIGVLLLTFLSFGAYANTIRVSIVTDWNTVQYFGTPDWTRNAINYRMDEVTQIFKNDLELNIVVSNVFVPADASQDVLPKHLRANILLDELVQYRTNKTLQNSSEVTLWLTSRDLIGVTSESNTGSICTAQSAAVVETIIEDFSDARQIAHALGHVIGSLHDDELTTSDDKACTNTSYEHIMSGNHQAINIPQFSECTKRVVKKKYYDSACFPKSTAVTPPTSTQSGGGGSMELWFLTLLVLLFLANRKQKT